MPIPVRSLAQEHSMNQSRWQITLAIILMVIAASLYILQIYLFHAERDTFFYLFQDLAFVPIRVLLVTIIVDRVIILQDRASGCVQDHRPCREGDGLAREKKRPGGLIIGRPVFVFVMKEKRGRFSYLFL